MRDISLVMLYYETPEMLRRQMEFFAHYPPDVGRHLHVILVDDGSPTTPAAPLVTPEAVRAVASLRVYRTLVDILWNEEFATNLGASQVETEWYLHTDLDHEVPAETLRTLMCGEFDREAVYMLSRMRVTEGRAPELINSSPASWFLTRALFDKLGGLDERFAGRYLPSDHDFTDRAMRLTRVEVLDALLVAHTSGTCPAPRTNDAEMQRVFAERVARRGAGAPLRMLSPWERVL